MKTFHQLFNQSIKIHAFTDGKVIRLENIPDQAFSYRLIGDGLALEVNTKEIYAPCSGKIETIALTKHAFTMTLDNQAQLLVHIGLYQDEPHPEYFQYHVNVGDYVSEGTHILTLHDHLLQNQSIIIPIVILNYQQYPIRSFTTSSFIKQGKTLFTLK